MTTTHYGTLAIDDRNLTSQRFVLRVPQINHPQNRALAPQDIQGTLDMPLVGGQMLRVFNSAVVFENLCDMVVSYEQHGQMMAAFARAALPVQMARGSELALGRLVPLVETAGHEMNGWGFESFAGPSSVVPICNGDTLQVSEKVTFGHVIQHCQIDTVAESCRDAGYKSEDTGVRFEGTYPITFKTPPQIIMKMYALRGLPAEITCP